MLVQVKTPRLTAGLKLTDNVGGGRAYEQRVIETAPILKYMKDWTFFKVRCYCMSKEWQCIIVGDKDAKPAR